MGWSNEAMEALRRWVSPKTWYKLHPSEETRFSVFVGTVWRDTRAIWNEAAARETIVNEALKVHGEPSKELAEETAAKMVSRGTAMLSFLSDLEKEGRLDLLGE